MTDDAFLDELFDRVLVRLLEGADADLDTLLAGREHLRERAAETVRLARVVTGTRAGAAPDQKVIGGYELVEELGRGASSVVWLARQRAVSDRLVALKLLAQGPFASERARHRFAAEVRAMARVRHPNIVPVLDVVETDEVQGFAMEWIRGRSLAELIRRHRESSSSEASDPAALADHRYVPWVCRVGVALGRALQAVHDQRLLHRDVKPSNVLIDERGEALLSDFGLVHDEQASLHTRTGDFVGTLAYSAPEQLAGQALDARADVYGLGATLYHALTAEPPFRSHSVAEVLARLQGPGVPPLRRVRPKLPRDLETVVHKAMAVERERRYPTAAEFADDLQRVLDLVPVRAHPPGPGYRALRFVQRHRAVVLGMAGGALVAVAVFVAALWRLQRAEERAHEFATRVETARLALFDGQLWQRTRTALLRGSAVDTDQTLGLLDVAAAAYDRALELDPDHLDLVLERATLRIAAARLAGHDPPVIEAFDRCCPRAAASLRGEAPRLDGEIAAADARALGVMSYLLGDLETAVAALEHCERDGAADVYATGLLGAVLAAQGLPERALPRVLELAQRYAGRGGLQIEAGMIAAECGDAPLAERLLALAQCADEPPHELGVRSLQGDIAWLRGDDRSAEQHYRAANSYHRLLLLWTARGDWRRAILGALNYIPLEPNEPRHRHALLVAVDAWWASRTADERRALLLDATAGGIGDVGSMFGVLLGVARAQAMLQTLAPDEVPPLLAPFQRTRFERDRLARTASDVVGLVRCMQVARLDLSKLAAASADDRARLVDAWLNGDAAIAGAVAAELGVLLPRDVDPFVMAGDRPPPPGLDDWRELARPVLGQRAMWVEGVATLRGPRPRIAMTGLGGSDAERLRGVVELRELDGTPVATVRGEVATGRLGDTVSNAGDLDGDGFDDAALGTAGLVQSGRPEQVWLVSGRNGVVLAVLEGREPADSFGEVVVGLGDVDGDGAPEIAVSAPQASRAGRSRCGAVAVLKLDGTTLHEHAGRDALVAYGQSLAALGDVDGDGACDFAIGSECEGAPLHAEVRSGRTGMLLFRLEEPDYVVGSACVAGLADVDGDRVPDWVAAFATLRPWQPPAGRVVVVSGRTGERLRELHGERPGDGFGLYATALGDLDGESGPCLAVTSSCEVSALPPVVQVFAADGRRLATLSGVWRLLPAFDRGAVVAVTLGAWGRYGAAPMGSGAIVAHARWPR